MGPLCGGEVVEECPQGGSQGCEPVGCQCRDALSSSLTAAPKQAICVYGAALSGRPGVLKGRGETPLKPLREAGSLAPLRRSRIWPAQRASKS